MDKIEVSILDHNLYENFPTFLAKLTQRGHMITCMDDLTKIRPEFRSVPNEKLVRLPHTTIMRMNYVTIAIVGLSTKALTQLRTHAKRATCISTSTQYSSYENRNNNYVIPEGLSHHAGAQMRGAYNKVQEIYSDLILSGVDKDKAGYLLPQGLRKAFIMHANIDDWRYILRTRLCRRNTEEVQHICNMIYKQICDINPVWLKGCLPECAYTKCKEGSFCCGKPIDKKEYEI